MWMKGLILRRDILYPEKTLVFSSKGDKFSFIHPKIWDNLFHQIFYNQDFRMHLVQKLNKISKCISQSN